MSLSDGRYAIAGIAKLPEVESLRSGKIVMVLDNARIIMRLPQPLLEEQKEQVEITFLPP
ncbi:hypothetical protein [Paenibacillus sp. TC-CSREp1]|uniref:hypothetical protein n=1 Tax=Paenibacillus sp. TC-CSREp1 TaxID=3410089 RepID=UPI003D05C1D2